jgi:hypothetical protein
VKYKKARQENLFKNAIHKAGQGKLLVAHFYKMDY